MTDHRKRPRDPNQLGKLIIDIATGQVPDRWLKVRDAIRCPACGLLYKYSREKLSLQITEAREGRYDPLRYIHRAKSVAEFPEGRE
jgi:hypothetical protein